MSAFIAPPTPSYTEADTKTRAAKLVSDLLSPGHLVIALLLVVGWSSTGSPAGLGWGLLAAVFCGFVPLGIIHAGVRRGTLTDKHVRVRHQRVMPLSAGLVSVLAGLTLLAVLGAPADVSAVVIAMLAGLISVLAVTFWWQVSVHSAVAAGTVTVLLLRHGWPVLPLAALVVVVGWSRLVLKAHTTVQLVCGAALGGVTSLLFQIAR
ncbi:hypothetical protein [Streptomyces sp. MMS20-AI2-20]|uniref:hypothetical protein n=1 Tax=Streptomyces TaxID=1883 RepID=UPI001F615E07|nr:hypothetical protein [Streptomyces sp. MMS20-AI2-20]MCI4146677.1 hypothetical protein [Streptomyces sp. MMS20-AI2-20]